VPELGTPGQQQATMTTWFTPKTMWAMTMTRFRECRTASAPPISINTT
jgi:hypothetical protein